MLMWLLNATTEKQRKGIADYFSPTIPLSRISGGGDGSFGGDSVFSEDRIAQNGTGASSLKPSTERQAVGQTGADMSQAAEAAGAGDRAAEATRFAEAVRRIEEALMGIGGESMVSAQAARHIVTRVTDEGLIVDLFDLEDEPLFEAGSDTPAPVALELAGVLSRVFALVGNGIAVNGHIRAQPEVLRVNPAWDLSASRAMRMRSLLEAAGLAPDRMARVTGLADRKPILRNPMAVQNNRIEVILLRSDLRGTPPGLRNPPDFIR
jgi:chemotaxis protein MotB